MEKPWALASGRKKMVRDNRKSTAEDHACMVLEVPLENHDDMVLEEKNSQIADPLHFDPKIYRPQTSLICHLQLQHPALQMACVN